MSLCTDQIKQKLLDLHFPSLPAAAGFPGEMKAPRKEDKQANSSETGTLIKTTGEDGT